MTTADARGLRPMRAGLVAVGSVVAAATPGQFLAGADPRARLTELDTTSLVYDVPWILAVWRNSVS